MDEEKKILEKRSSFRGWKERNKERTHKKKKIIGITIIISIFFVMMAYSYVSKIDDDKIDDNISSSIGKNNTSFPIKQNSTVAYTNKSYTNTTKTNKSYTNTTKTNASRNVIGKIGVPLINNGFEITVKSISLTEIRVTVWIIVKNKDNYEKPFKLGSGTTILDNIGQQYENIKVARSAEIAQTNLSAQAMREGAIFFERLKDGRSPKKLTLNINNDKIEFVLDNTSGDI